MINYCNTDYAGNGNILTRTDVGTYGYAGQNAGPHAVTGITDATGTLLQERNQAVSYTAFNKVSHIAQGGLDYFITYGSDRLRLSTSLHNDMQDALMTKQYAFGDYERETSPAGTRHLHYIQGGDGLAAVYVKTDGGSDSLYFILKDHLGSITGAINSESGKVYHQSFDAWGRKRNPENWSYTDIPDFPLERGYTGHEHLKWFGLINMNGRMYDAGLCRFLSPDPYVQMPDYSQNFNRYSYALNNPLVYTDPSGEFLWAVVAAWLVSSETGYEVQKYVSPVAVHVDVHLFSSEQKGIGIDASVGVPKALPVSYRAHAGATYYWQHYDGSYEGWETRYGGEWTFGGVLSYSGTTFTSGETSQTTNMITLGNPFVNIKYENDYMFGAGKYFPGVPAADGGDRYRTAAARLKVGPFSVGVNLFTGDPGLDGLDRETKLINGREHYVENIYGDNPDKYRAGIFYVGVGPFKFGRNSERIRNTFQNRFAHDYITHGESPYFLWLDRDPEWYFYLGSAEQPA